MRWRWTILPGRSCSPWALPELPGVGTKVAALVVVAVVVNQLAGPVLWERAIVAAGESGRTGHKKRATREGGLRS